MSARRAPGALLRIALIAVSIFATAGGLVITGLLMGSHMPFRTDPAAARSGERRTGAWQVVYLFGSDCPCSARAAKHIACRRRLGDIAERVVMVGSDRPTETSLAGNGWKPEHATAEQARDLYGARSAPLLIFIDPAGRIRYTGGFARRSDFRDGFQEERIWAALRSGETVKPLPAYGCALQFGCGVGSLGEVKQDE